MISLYLPVKVETMSKHFQIYADLCCGFFSPQYLSKAHQYPTANLILPATPLCDRK